MIIKKPQLIDNNGLKLKTEYTNYDEVIDDEDDYNDYEVIFTESHTGIISVTARDRNHAEELAREEYSYGNIEMEYSEDSEEIYETNLID